MESFRRIIRQYLSFSRSDRNAVIVLSLLIILVLIANVIVSNLEPKSISDKAEFDRIWNEWNRTEPKTKEISAKQVLFSFDPNSITRARLDSLSLPKYVKSNLINYRNAGGKFSSADDLRKIYGMSDSLFKEIKPYLNIRKKTPVKYVSEKKKMKTVEGHFDPNTATRNELKRFGFNDFQTNNLLSYRENGGKFKTVEDIHKIYGIDSTFLAGIDKHIQFEETIENYILDKRQPVSIELNSADSLQLLQLKGIGSVYAKRILNYRELLGGFYSKQQLLEVYNFPQETYKEIEQSINVDTLLVKKIRLNFADFKELLSHPYLNKSQVKAIINYRDQNGAFKEVSSVYSVDGISRDVALKIEPYFTCN